MGSQKQDIDGTSIEHSQVQQVQAGGDPVSFQNSHYNHVTIENTFRGLFSRSEPPKVDWDWAMRLLKEKQLPEIRKRLTDTLGRDRILMDVSIEEQQSWVNRSPLAADRILQVNGEDCGKLDANKMLIETFGRDDIEGKLLILGAPGAGKTTALLSLAEQLVCGAISQPQTVIPVIFELSTWHDDQQSIESWLIAQLYDLHGGNPKSKPYEQWLERQVLLPLLDGLDELGLERQKKCTEKLNEFAENYPHLVICCRVKEFEAVNIKLGNLRGAVCLQSLSDSQIQHYLESLDRSDVWDAMQTTPYLQDLMKPTRDGDPGLLRIPLFVKLIADVYDPHQPISSKADLLDKYIDRQLSFDKREFDRRKELKEYKWAFKSVKLEPKWEQTCCYLNWISRNLQSEKKVEFLIEKIKVSSLLDFNMLHYLLISSLIFTFMQCIGVIGFMSWLSFLLSWWIDNGSSLVGGWSDLSITLQLMIKTGSVASISIAVVIFASIVMMAGILVSLNDIEPMESFQIQMSKTVKQEIFNILKHGLIFILFIRLVLWLCVNTEEYFSDFIEDFPNTVMKPIISLSVIIFNMGIPYRLYYLIELFKKELKVRSYPNEGI